MKGQAKYLLWVVVAAMEEAVNEPQGAEALHVMAEVAGVQRCWMNLGNDRKIARYLRLYVMKPRHRA
jgi:hypothetical protein